MDYTEEYQLQIEKIREALGCDIIALALVEPAENLHVLKWQYISGNISERIKKVVLQSGKGIAGGVFKNANLFWWLMWKNLQQRKIYSTILF